MKFFPRIFLAAFLAASPAVHATPVKLPFGDAANVPLNDDVANDEAGGWSDQGKENSLSGFPEGEVTFEGVPFLIPGGSGNAAIAFENKHRKGMPQKVAIPANGAKGASLYILSSCAFEFSRGQEVAMVTIRYADGSSQSEPIIYERHTGSWWTPSTPEEGIVAWRGHNALGLPIGVYLSRIKLDEPEIPVEGIEIRCAGNRGIFFLLGLSLSDNPEPISIPPLWLPEPLSTEGWIPSVSLSDNGRQSVWEIDAAKGGATGRRLVAELDLPLRKIAPGEEADLARLLRLLGYGAARLPSLETILPPTGSPVTTGADPESMESLTRLAQALRKEGLALSLTLGGGRQYGIDDRVAAYRQINGLLANQCLVDPEARRLLLDSARCAGGTKPDSVDILSASILLGDYGTLLTPPHLNMLQNAWKAWLTNRYGTNEALVAAWQVPDSPPPVSPKESLARSGIDLLNVHDFTAYQARFRKRFADQMEFLEELQTGWLAKIVPELREIFPGARIYSPGLMATEKLGDFQTRPSSMLDGIEECIGDSYQGTGSDGAIYAFNRSPFMAPERWSYRPAFNRIAGKPFVIAEISSAWPGDYEFARLLLTMVFGGLQGWDGIVHRGISTLRPTPPMAQPSTSNNSLQNPAFLAILPLGRNLFARGDLDPAPIVFSRTLESPKSFREVGSSPIPLSLQSLLFVGSVEASLDGGGQPDTPVVMELRANGTTTLKSLTGQVECDFDSDLLKVASPRSVAIAGKGGGSIQDGPVGLEAGGGYGVVYATSLTSAPLATSPRILLGAVGRTRNSGQKFEISNGPLGLNEHLWRIREPGKPPILMEPIKGTLTLKGIPAGRWTLQPLNLLGQPLDIPARSIATKDDTLAVNFTNEATPLLLLSHEAP